MNSEKAKEIKKALECCTNNKGCEPCSRLSKKPYHLDDCRFNLLADISTLINELESENERLCSKHRNLEINYNDTWEHYREYEIENQQLKDRIAELENAKVVYETVDYCYEDLKKAENRIAELENGIAKSMLGCEFLPECTNEKLKQFAERLKDRLRYTSPTSDVLELSGLVFDGKEVEQCIDETLKEFIK